MELLSLTQLASLTGRSWRTTKKILKDAPIAGQRQGGAVYESMLALPLLFNSNPAMAPCDDCDSDKTEAYVYEVEKARLTKIQADIQQLKKDKLAESLVDRKETEKDYFNVGRIVRDAILDVPIRLAAELASCTDIHTVQHRMTEDLTKALETLVKDERRE